MQVDGDQQHNALHQFSFEYMKKAVDFYDEVNEETGKKKHAWESFQHCFQNVRNRKYIERFRKYLENGGTKKQKLDEIDKHTYEKFKEARSGFLFIHDIHLKRWALQKAREINHDTFSASDSWLLRFKRRHALCSRKVTKLITQREITDSDSIINSTNNFTSKIEKILPHY